jgi:hypothetical protein
MSIPPRVSRALPARLMAATGAALVAAALAGPAAAQSPDPYAPGTRWTALPGATAPWMPVSVRFGAGGELVFVGAGLSTPQWLVYGSTLPPASQGVAQAATGLWAAPSTLSNLTVSCGDGAHELFGLAQIPDPDSSHRRTEISRFDPLAPGGLAALWTHDMGWRANGPAKFAVARDGARAVAVLQDSATQQLRIDWLDGATGALLGRVDRAGGTLRPLAVDEDCDVVACVVGLELLVFDGGGALRHQEALASATQALALSGDGSTLIVGAPGLLRVLQWTGAAYVERMREQAPAGELPVRVAASHDGSTWAAAWWNAATGRDVRLELRSAPGDLQVFERWQFGSSSGPQNFPEVVLLARDGSRAAFGLWGCQDAQPEVLLVEQAGGGSVAEIDLPGSVTALDLDPSGTRLAIGMKHGHANQFATTGEVRLFDTGERALQALGPALAGAPLPVTARRSGAGSVWFLYGPRAAPSVLPGIGGVLELRRRGLRALVVPADAFGRADGWLPMPSSPPPTGVPYAVQALFRSAAGSVLSAAVLEPLAL